MNEKIAISSSESCVVVYFTAPEHISIRGEISANAIASNEWWIARAIINPEKLRCQGLGSKMLSLLKNEVVKQGCKKLIVCPGGYEAKKRKQFNFYKKNGFEKDKNNKGQLNWIPEQEK